MAGGNFNFGGRRGATATTLLRVATYTFGFPGIPARTHMGRGWDIGQRDGQVGRRFPLSFTPLAAAPCRIRSGFNQFGS